MGQKVKIADLKKFDVFRSKSDEYGLYNDDCLWVKLGGYNYMLMAGFIVKVFEVDELDNEVELLGQMEFIKTEDKIHGDNYFGSASQR